MINALRYYYNININEIHQKDNAYSFKSNNEKYMLSQYENDKEELKEIYNLSIYLKKIGVPCHEIIINNEGNIITIINGTKYILFKIKIENRIIRIIDLINLSNIYIDTKQYRKIIRGKWSTLWSKKIDYMEYQIEQLKNKFSKIENSIDYYIGIVENCIQMLNTETTEEQIKIIAHKRIEKNYTTEDFYNPINLIIDNRARDISEYIKTNMIESSDILKEIEQYIYVCKLSTNEIKLLFIRILYPNIYFDICEKIIENKIDEKEIEKYTKNVEENEKKILNIYNYFLKKIPLPEIEWLKKKELSNIDNTFNFRNFIS